MLADPANELPFVDTFDIFGKFHIIPMRFGLTPSEVVVPPGSS